MACLESLSKSKSMPGLEFRSPHTGFPTSRVKIDMLACGLHRQQTHVGVLCEEELIACFFFPPGFGGGKCMLSPTIVKTVHCRRSEESYPWVPGKGQEEVIFFCLFQETWTLSSFISPALKSISLTVDHCWELKKTSEYVAI